MDINIGEILTFLISHANCGTYTLSRLILTTNLSTRFYIRLYMLNKYSNLLPLFCQYVGRTTA